MATRSLIEAGAVVESEPEVEKTEPIEPVWRSELRPFSGRIQECTRLLGESASSLERVVAEKEPLHVDQAKGSYETFESSFKPLVELWKELQEKGFSEYQLPDIKTPARHYTDQQPGLMRRFEEAWQKLEEAQAKARQEEEAAKVLREEVSREIAEQQEILQKRMAAVRRRWLGLAGIFHKNDEELEELAGIEAAFEEARQWLAGQPVAPQGPDTDAVYGQFEKWNKTLSNWQYHHGGIDPLLRRSVSNFVDSGNRYDVGRATEECELEGSYVAGDIRNLAGWNREFIKSLEGKTQPALNERITKEERKKAAESAAEKLSQQVFRDLAIDEQAEEKILAETGSDRFVDLRFYLEVLRRSFANIRESVRSHLRFYLEEYGAAPETEERLVEELRAELARVKESFAVEYREDMGDLLKIANADGDIKPFTTLVQEAYRSGSAKTPEAMLRKGGGGSASAVGNNEYYKRRDDADRALLGSKKAVSAMLSDQSTPGGKEAPGIQYGDVVIRLNWENVRKRTLFTESDSMNANGLSVSLRGPKKSKDPQTRQIVHEHALLSKAIYNVDAKRHPEKVHEKMFGGFSIVPVDNACIRYVEAQVIDGFSLSEANAVKIDLGADEGLGLVAKYRSPQEIVDALTGKFPNLAVEFANSDAMLGNLRSRAYQAWDGALRISAHAAQWTEYFNKPKSL